MTEETRSEKINGLVKVLKDGYREGLTLALEGSGAKIASYLNRIQSFQNFAVSMMISGYIDQDGVEAVSKMFENLRLMIISNDSSEKYNSKNGLIDTDLFEANLRRYLLENA